NGSETVRERHRHRYQINPAYLRAFEENGFVVSGFSSEGFPEIMELRNYRFYFGVQYHPEFKSRPLRPSPVFTAFINALLT
ncbi:MAG: CTP synthetase, partial [Zestosphaera sp.]